MADAARAGPASADTAWLVMMPVPTAAPAPSQADVDRVLAASTRARLLASGVVNGQAIGGPLLAETDDLAPIARALRVKGGPAMRCMCHGDLAIVLGDHAISFHHGVSIRLEGFGADALLEDGRRLLEWLASRGVKEPLEAYDRAVEAERAAREAHARWSSHAPASVKPHLDALESGQPASVAAELRELLVWLGSSESRWAQHPSYESVAERLIAQHGVAAVVRLLDDERVRAGAARFIALYTRSRVDKEPLAKVDARLLLPHAKDADARARLVAALQPLRAPDVPPGCELAGIALHGRPWALATDGARAYAIDGSELCAFDAGERRVVARFERERPAFLAASDGVVAWADGKDVVTSEGERIATARGRVTSPRFAGGSLYFIDDVSPYDGRPISRFLVKKDDEILMPEMDGSAWDLAIAGGDVAFVRRLEGKTRVERAGAALHEEPGQKWWRMAAGKEIWFTDPEARAVRQLGGPSFPLEADPLAIGVAGGGAVVLLADGQVQKMGGGVLARLAGRPGEMASAGGSVFISLDDYVLRIPAL